MKTLCGLLVMFGVSAAAVGQQAPPASTTGVDNMVAATAPALPGFKVFQFPADMIPRIDGANPPTADL